MNRRDFAKATAGALVVGPVMAAMPVTTVVDGSTILWTSHPSDVVTVYFWELHDRVWVRRTWSEAYGV